MVNRLVQSIFFVIVLKLSHRLINAILRQPVAIRDIICHLSELPADATWNGMNTLSTASGRAIVVVAFGSLSSINLAIARGKATTLSVTIDLLREKDVDSLRSVYNLAQVPRSRCLFSFLDRRVTHA